LSPRFKNASAHILPNPLEAPVIKIVFAIALFFNVETKIQAITEVDLYRSG
jgi:hypothetical protein